METVAFRMVLHPGMREEYERRHAQIRPDLVELLRDAGIRDYRIFFDPSSHHLFAVLRRPRHHGMDALASHALMRRWWESMRDIMQTEPGGEPFQVALQQVFHLE